MTTFAELLPATKSSQHNALSYTPSETVAGAGLLHISTDRAWVEYLTVSTPTDGGRDVVLAKTTSSPGTDKDESEYTVSVRRFGCSCSCKGFAYGRGRDATGRPTCKHIEAVRCLIDNGQI